MNKYKLHFTIESLDIHNRQITIIAKSSDIAVETLESMIELEFGEELEVEIDDTQYLDFKVG